MEALFISTGVVALAEIGDKTRRARRVCWQQICHQDTHEGGSFHCCRNFCGDGFVDPVQS